MKPLFTLLLMVAVLPLAAVAQIAIVPAVPHDSLLMRPFGAADEAMFAHPSREFYPETWFHFVGGNVDRVGITHDLEAIARAGITGIAFFHGAVGDGTDWPGTREHTECLSPRWESLLTHTASEAHRLGLRFSIQTCPGWAMSGGPWVKPEQAMRHIAYSRTDVIGGRQVVCALPAAATDTVHDYRDIMVVAFPTPEDDTGQPLSVAMVQADTLTGQWYQLVNGQLSQAFTLAPGTHDVVFTLPEMATVRSIVFNAIDDFNHAFGVDPAIMVRVAALTAEGEREVLYAPMPRANWEDAVATMTFALDEAPANRYRLTLTNAHPMTLHHLGLYSAARKNNWEAEAAWTLRELVRSNDSPHQTLSAYVNDKSVIDITPMMQTDGTLRWDAPQGHWTVLRIGHVNTLMQNGPAPAEATGWEINKLDATLADYQFDHYVGRLANGALHGLVDNMLMDSWECRTQTWTQGLDSIFASRTGYDLTPWMPALLGYVVDTPERTARFLCDWRRTINDLFVHNFYGRMSERAHALGMTASYETAAADVFPADALEYYKWADVPMCEFWQPATHFLANRNYKPIRPTASAAHLYGKPRVSAEAFTSFDLTWDEHFSMLREVAHRNLVEGMTHFVFHTYTHNPDAEHYFPGTSFGGAIGTPFLRQQTWWPYMPSFTQYLARCTFMLERGKPVADVLWYLGDEIAQKPDQYADFPVGYRYDYCNTDALLHRISVRDGKWVTPDGIAYEVLWLPDGTKRLLPATVKRLHELVKQGGRLIGNAPESPATLTLGAEERFHTAVASLWGGDVGLGRVISGQRIAEGLQMLGIAPDVSLPNTCWLHRRTADADWYMVLAPDDMSCEEASDSSIVVRCVGTPRLWNPLTGRVEPLRYATEQGKTRLWLQQVKGACSFVVFDHDAPEVANNVQSPCLVRETVLRDWQLSFPSDWGVTPQTLQLDSLMAWRELPLSDEGKAFSGTATYATQFHLKAKAKHTRYVLRLGRVEEIAVVSVNGRVADTLWCAPYTVDVTSLLRKGRNTIRIDVTSTWRNRLIYDALLPEEKRRTWVIAGPEADEPLGDSGLLDEVRLQEYR